MWSAAETRYWEPFGACRKEGVLRSARLGGKQVWSLMSRTVTMCWLLETGRSHGSRILRHDEGTRTLQMDPLPAGRGGAEDDAKLIDLMQCGLSERNAPDSAARSSVQQGVTWPAPETFECLLLAQVNRLPRRVLTSVVVVPSPGQGARGAAAAARLPCECMATRQQSLRRDVQNTGRVRRVKCRARVHRPRLPRNRSDISLHTKRRPQPLRPLLCPGITRQQRHKPRRAQTAQRPGPRSSELLQIAALEQLSTVPSKSPSNPLQKSLSSLPLVPQSPSPCVSSAAKAPSPPFRPTAASQTAQMAP